MTATTRPSPQPGALAVAGARLWRARRLVERNIMVYRHQWIVILSGVAEPIFYLFGIGLGLGGLITSVPLGAAPGDNGHVPRLIETKPDPAPAH